VRITAQQVRLTPPAYVFLVTNLSAVPLETIFIGSTISGTTKSGGMIAAGFNTPTRTTLPVGWTASLTGTGGGLYFSYRWQTNDKTKTIKPGESRCDFRVELPVFHPPKEPLYADEVMVVQTNFQNIPFLVIWPGGEQTEGVVKADLLVK
jgi:hypothetical protein